MIRVRVRVGMGKFNSDDPYIYYCGQESLRRNGVALIVNKRLWNVGHGCNLKKLQNDHCSFPRQTTQYHNWSWMVLCWLTGPSGTNTKNRCPSHDRRLECKITKSRDIWNNRKFWPWSTKLSRAKANRVLSRENVSHSKHPIPVSQERLYPWTSSGGQYQNQIDYIFCGQR